MRPAGWFWVRQGDLRIRERSELVRRMTIAAAPGPLSRQSCPPFDSNPDPPRSSDMWLLQHIVEYVNGIGVRWMVSGYSLLTRLRGLMLGPGPTLLTKR
uniref:Uncharacterized protein n=1 Tax=Oryza nivara TaxID=4536 RepID=A0A0E0HWH7_ORYNI